MINHFINTIFQVTNGYEDVKFELFWDKGMDNSKALQFNAKVTPQQITAKFLIPSKSGSVQLKRLENGFVSNVQYDKHFIDSEVEWRKSDGIYGIKGSLDSSVSYLNNLKGVAKCSLKEVTEGRKMAGQVRKKSNS